jgi:hypothetical protein
MKMRRRGIRRGGERIRIGGGRGRRRRGES